MALSDRTFITVAEVKSHIDETATTWDTIIETLINQCTDYAVNYCGGRRLIAPTADETEYYNGNGNKIFLRNFPIKSITSISYATGPYNNLTWTAFNGAYDYIKNDRTGVLTFTSLPEGTQNIKVVYKGGYDTAANVPYDLKLAVTQAVARVFNKRKSEGISNESIGGGAISWDKDKEFLSILDNYKVFL